jgi:hypothetical protein
MYILSRKDTHGPRWSEVPALTSMVGGILQ